jgi:hypothetical protein
MKPNYEIFGPMDQRCDWRRKNEAYKDKNTLPTVKHDGGSVMLWGVSLLVALGISTVLKASWIQTNTRIFWPRMSLSPLKSLSLGVIELSSKTMTPSTHHNPPRLG